MMHTLLQWDTAVMHWINSGWSNAFFDWLLPAMRNKYLWLPLYVFCLGWILFNFTPRQSLYVILFAILAIFASDTISSKLIKNTVHRPSLAWTFFRGDPASRVVVIIPLMQPIIFCGSCHSSLRAVYGRWKHLWWLWALHFHLPCLCCVHYPLDILGKAELVSYIGMSMGTITKHQMKQEVSG
jgi:undecaprenyl-diphosphatase